MAVRTTVDIPETLHETRRHRAEQSGTSIRALIVRALEDAYQKPKKGKYVRGPLIKAGKRGPAYPVDETLHDLILP